MNSPLKAHGSLWEDFIGIKFSEQLIQFCWWWWILRIFISSKVSICSLIPFRRVTNHCLGWPWLLLHRRELNHLLLWMWSKPIAKQEIAMRREPLGGGVLNGPVAKMPCKYSWFLVFMLLCCSQPHSEKLLVAVRVPSEGPNCTKCWG